MKGKLMADSSPLAGLLDRAGHVFSLAHDLGRAFPAEMQSRSVFIDPAIWQRHAPKFDEFYTALLDLRDAMRNPPDGFGPVADRLMQATNVAKQIRESLARGDGFSEYLDHFTELNTLADAGFQDITDTTKAQRLDDPLAFVDEPAATTDFTLLDRFPATLAGHVAFLEWVRDEVHQAAEAKRSQTERGYSNATIQSMVGGIKWTEARQRLEALTSLPAGTMEQVARVLRRDLTTGTLERIEELLTPAVRELREGYENRDDSPHQLSDENVSERLPKTSDEAELLKEAVSLLRINNMESISAASNQIALTAAHTPVVAAVDEVNENPPTPHTMPNDTLLELACDDLGPVAEPMVRALWGKTNGVSFDTLAYYTLKGEETNDESIIQTLKRVRKNWLLRATNEKFLGLLELTISKSQRKATLKRLPPA